MIKGTQPGVLRLPQETINLALQEYLNKRLTRNSQIVVIDVNQDNDAASYFLVDVKEKR
jgi:hypothetical protein